jgi:low temperature requirement protein LtrA
MGTSFYMKENRHATWLELFFDLIFVVVIGKITHLFGHTVNGHIELDTWLKFVLLFIPAWWIWYGHTNYANRFDDDKRSFRFLTLSLMFLLILMSIGVSNEIEEQFQFIVIIYSVSRLFISGFYYSIGFRFPNKKKYSLAIGSIYGIGAIISLLSIFFTFPFSVVVFYAGIGFDILAPIYFKTHTKTHPVDKEHIVERIGLLGIILLGESIVALSESINDVNWTLQTVIIAVTGFAILCMIWWIYYDSFYFLKNSKLDRDGHAISYSQLLTYMAFAILANMIRHAILHDLDVLDFRIMVSVGMILFFIGKQTSYWFNVPEHRRFNTINALISLAIVASGLIFKKEIYMMAAVCISMMTYITLTHFAHRRMYGRDWK